MSIRGAVGWLAAVMALWAAAGAGWAATEERGTPSALRLAAGGSGGNYLAVARALRDRLLDAAPDAAGGARVVLQVLETGGSYENGLLLRQQQCDLALIQSDVAMLEHYRSPTFQALAAIYPEPVHAVFRRELGIGRLSELESGDRRWRISFGEREGGSAVHAWNLLDRLELGAGRIEPAYLSLPAALEQLRRRTLDGLFFTSAAPVPLLQEAAREEVIHLAAIDPDILADVDSATPLLVNTSIPYELYAGHDEDVPTLGTWTLLVAARDLPGESVRRILDGLYGLAEEARGAEEPERLPFLRQLTPVTGLRNVPIPVHSAAEQYHEEHWSWLPVAWSLLRRYGLPLLVLAAPLLAFLRFSRLAYFLHQFVIGRVLVLLVIIWLMGASVMYLVEAEQNSHFRTFGQSAVAILHYLFSGLESKEPVTGTGHVVSIIILSLGVAVATLFTATIVTLLVERALNLQRLRRKPVLKLARHVVIAGWSRRSEQIVRHLRSPDLREHPPLVVVTPGPARVARHDRRRFKNVWAVQGRPTDPATLKRANLDSARTAVLLSDDPTDPDSDLETVATTLAVERYQPRVHTVVESLRPDSVEHFRFSSADEIVDVSSIAQKLIAQCVLSPGISRAYLELLTFGRGSQEIYFEDLPEGLTGRTFPELQRRLSHLPILPIGLRDRAGGVRLNPRRSSRRGSGRAEDGSPPASIIYLADEGDMIGRSSGSAALAGAEVTPDDRCSLPTQLRGAEMTETRIGICGWNRQARDIIQQLHDPVIAGRHRYLVTVITPAGSSEIRERNGELLQENVSFVFGDPTRRGVLANGGVADFSSLVVLAERAEGTPIAHADHKSLMVALAANDLHPELHTVVEVIDPENQEHFQRISGIEIVSVQDVTEKILAQAVVTPGITEVFVRLLTASADTNEIYIVPVPSAWRGETFQTAYEATAQSEEDLILLGYRTADGPLGERLHLNPRTTPGGGDTDAGRDHVLEDGDELVVLAYEEPSWAP